MFEIPRRSKQARNFECSENSRSQIVFQIDILRKLALDAPGCVECWIKQWFYQKRAVFHLISKHSLNINFLCISFMNYWWVWEVWSRCEWTVRFFLCETEYQVMEKLTCHGGSCMLSGFKPVCIYSYHLFILLAVKTILYSIRKNRSRINYYILIAFDYSHLIIFIGNAKYKY